MPSFPATTQLNRQAHSYVYQSSTINASLTGTSRGRRADVCTCCPKLLIYRRLIGRKPNGLEPENAVPAYYLGFGGWGQPGKCEPLYHLERQKWCQLSVSGG